MKIFLTSGTYDYLQSIQQNHPNQQIYLMQGEGNTKAYAEGDNPFDEALTYEIVDQVNDFQHHGYVVMNNIPVTDEGRPIFEDRFKNRAGAIENTPGFLALRILRPLQGNTYTVLTLWKDEQSFEEWKTSQAFDKAHKNNGPHKKEKPGYIAGPSYLTKYHVIES
ncbi:antibiotic biosynthesis monooxygenase family protein [Pontibacillus litoralis]|uniref:ABM domain-containing protein n=1 Tax=Pontibacillus litoralis JSM 072002 TaxID=1385512 RepID=A0A0A5HM81_9BACI|nr:antibiotic biosynthesis monooxygenase [Pontibacillus litoralis]KGX84737.1 hypothetical protein N784_12040 [Pontibacillus litoralis JSM 072002]